MTKASLAVLETALRARKLDRTLTTALPPLERAAPSALAPTAIVPLDAVLRGGLPRGQVSEVVGARSSGRTTVLLSLIAAAAGRGELAALIDTFDRLDVASAVAARIDLERLLWIRGHAISSSGDPGLEGRGPAWGMKREPPLVEHTIDRALKALNLVLQAGGFGVVVLDLADVAPLALKRIPFTTWLRVQRTIEGSETACVIVTPQSLARSAGGLTLALGPSSSSAPRGPETAVPSTSLGAGSSTSLRTSVRWAGASDRSRRLAGLDIAGRVISPRRRVDGEVRFAAQADNSR